MARAGAIAAEPADGVALRILCIADTPPDPDSGAAGTDWQGVAALRRAGHEVVDLWADALPRRLRHGNLRYLLELPRAHAELVDRHLRARRFDVVQISQPHGYLAARRVRERHPGVVFVHRSHGFEGRVRRDLARWDHLRPDGRSPWRRLASTGLTELLEINNRGIARHAHGHIVSASACRDCLVEDYGVPVERVAVIRQGMPDQWSGVPAPLTPARSRSLLYVGQFAFIKGPIVLGRVVSEVLASAPDATFTWVCAGRHHGEARKLIDPGVRERVAFLDWMPQEQLRAVYDRHGIFLFPSFFEGFGKALFEAMGRGLAVVAADNSAASDLIAHGRNGLRVPTGDARAMANAVRALLGDPHRAEVLGIQAAVDASRLTWDRYAEEAGRFFERLLRREQGGP